MSDSEVLREFNSSIKEKDIKIRKLNEEKYGYVLQMAEKGISQTTLLLLTFHYEEIEDEISDVLTEKRNLVSAMSK